jgi:gluconate 2-dehydrogenase subunit 3-like protein
VNVLDHEQRALLRAVLNRIIPARDELPGAGDLDVDVSLEQSLVSAVELRRLVLDGLSEIDVRAGRAFVELDAASQTTVLEAVERTSPKFFAALVEHAYRGYYVLPSVQRAVVYKPRPPQPLGHTLPSLDAALLARQRERAPFWRRVPAR